MEKIRLLREREGELIYALIPSLYSNLIQTIRLHRVEDAGLWIESQALTDQMLQNLKMESAPKTLVFFVPWQQFAWIMDSIDVPALADSIAKL